MRGFRSLLNDTMALGINYPEQMSLCSNNTVILLLLLLLLLLIIIIIIVIIIIIIKGDYQLKKIPISRLVKV